MNYWVVGATWDTDDSQRDRFIASGIWQLGWEEGDHSPVRDFLRRSRQIRGEDRIAIKSLLGQGQSQIRVSDIGVVTGVVEARTPFTCTVNWIVTGLDRVVPMRGAVGAIYGPYQYGDEWVRRVSCL